MDYETKIYLEKLIGAMEKLDGPDWWSVFFTAISTIAVIVIAVVQIRLQKQQTKVQEYEIAFKKYSDKKLYKVINDEGYNKEAREAAKNLLRQRNMPV